MYFHLALGVGMLVHLSIAVLEHPLLELTGAVLQMYKHPEDVNSEDLFEAAKDYLYLLVKLKQETRILKAGSLDFLRKVYLEGNPPFHLRNVPWAKLINYYGWNDVNISAYHEIIDDTRRVWNECLAELEKNKEPDEII